MKRLLSLTLAAALLAALTLPAAAAEESQDARLAVRPTRPSGAVCPRNWSPPGT